MTRKDPKVDIQRWRVYLVETHGYDPDRLQRHLVVKAHSRDAACDRAIATAKRRWPFVAAWSCLNVEPRAGREGADECTECGQRFDATPRDKRPICPACR